VSLRADVKVEPGEQKRGWRHDQACASNLVGTRSHTEAVVAKPERSIMTQQVSTRRLDQGTCRILSTRVVRVGARLHGSTNRIRPV
jgi:hypothetical protein